MPHSTPPPMRFNIGMIVSVCALILVGLVIILREPLDGQLVPPPVSPPVTVSVPDSLRGYPVMIGATQRLDGSPARHQPLQLFARDTLTLIGTLYVPGVGWVTDTMRVTAAPPPPMAVATSRNPRS